MERGFLEELKARYRLDNATAGVQEALQQHSLSAYLGIDPTGPSLHIGSLATVSMLRHLQVAGHRPIVLVGGATGMIGDPSGKSAERNLLSIEEIQANVASQSQQLELLLDFDHSGTRPQIVNNYDWFRDFGFLEFLRDVGKHFTISYMLNKESVSQRLESGISFTEFSYQLLQAYDFYALHQQQNCKLQVGGSDQWGNITAGIELIRRLTGQEAYGITFPLITRADGSKFGKTAEGENIYLDPNLTSPYKFYQFWINVSDEDIPKMLRTYSFKDIESLEELIQQSQQQPGARIGQQALAEELMARIHGQKALEHVRHASQVLFGKSQPEELQSIEEATLEQIEQDIPSAQFSRDKLDQDTPLLQLFADAAFCQSKSEAKRLLKSGGLRVNKRQVGSESEVLSRNQLLHDHYLLLQKGKKDYMLVKFEA
jgi:tyrosyl-tRNA synthetase